MQAFQDLIHTIRRNKAGFEQDVWTDMSDIIALMAEQIEANRLALEASGQAAPPDDDATLVVDDTPGGVEIVDLPPPATGEDVEQIVDRTSCDMSEWCDC